MIRRPRVVKRMHGRGFVTVSWGNVICVLQMSSVAAAIRVRKPLDARYRSRVREAALAMRNHLGPRAPEFPVSHNALPVTFEHEELPGSIPSSGSSFDLSGK